MNDKIIEVFSSLERKIKNGVNVDCMVLEHQEGIDWRDLKDIIDDLYEEGRFVDVCKTYVKQLGERIDHVPMEYNRIVDDILREKGKIK